MNRLIFKLSYKNSPHTLLNITAKVIKHTEVQLFLPVTCFQWGTKSLKHLSQYIYIWKFCYPLKAKALPNVYKLLFYVWIIYGTIRFMILVMIYGSKTKYYENFLKKNHNVWLWIIFHYFFPYWCSWICFFRKQMPPTKRNPILKFAEDIYLLLMKTFIFNSFKKWKL